MLEQRVAQRRDVFERYCSGFQDIPGIEPQPEPHWAVQRPGINTPLLKLAGNRHTRWLSCFLIDDLKFGMPAGDLIRFLDASNVEARPVWKPMHTQKLYERYECIGGLVAEDLNRRGICLPSSSSLSLEDQHFVIDRIREAHFAAHERSNSK